MSKMINLAELLKLKAELVTHEQEELHDPVDETDKARRILMEEFKEFLSTYGLTLDIDLVLSDSISGEATYQRVVICEILKSKKFGYRAVRIATFLNRNAGWAYSTAMTGCAKSTKDPQFNTIRKAIYQKYGRVERKAETSWIEVKKDIDPLTYFKLNRFNHGKQKFISIDLPFGMLLDHAISYIVEDGFCDYFLLINSCTQVDPKKIRLHCDIEPFILGIVEEISDCEWDFVLSGKSIDSFITSFNLNKRKTLLICENKPSYKLKRDDNRKRPLSWHGTHHLGSPSKYFKMLGDPTKRNKDYSQYRWDMVLVDGKHDIPFSLYDYKAKDKIHWEDLHEYWYIAAEDKEYEKLVASALRMCARKKISIELASD